MIGPITEQWEENKHRLENYFRKTKQEEYDEYLGILKMIFRLVLKDKKYNVKKINQIDDGDYQGMYLFIIPEDTYQPHIDEYLFTYVEYGSCSGCDTLQGIHEYERDLPTEKQVADYMTLALHMVQRMKKWGDSED